MRSYGVFLFLLLSFMPLTAVQSASVSPIALDKLSTRAAIIFYGKALSNEVRKDEQSGLIATFTEFQIIEPVKGEVGNTHTIKQIGGESKEDNIIVRIPSVPKFIIGKDYVVFLPEKSKLGFSSPLGLQQGSFDVVTRDGERIISNARRGPSTSTSDSSIQLPLAASVDNPAAARLDDFLNTVRAYNAR